MIVYETIFSKHFGLWFGIIGLALILVCGEATDTFYAVYFSLTSTLKLLILFEYGCSS